MDEDVLVLYGQYIREQGLEASLPTLRGKVLVCDCALSQPCEADVLAGMLFDLGADPGKRAHRTKKATGMGASKRLVTLAGLASARAESIPLGPRLRWPQEVVVTAFTKLYPPDWFEGFAFPCIEDILNTPTFTEYPEWREARALPMDGPWGPRRSTAACSP